MILKKYGWNKYFQEKIEKIEEKNYLVGRVVSEFKQYFEIITEKGIKKAKISKKLYDYTFYSDELPIVGDWVVLKEENNCSFLFINEVLERKSKISRKRSSSGGRFNKPGTSEEQIIATNVDTIFFVMALDRDFNLRKLERYLTLIWDSGANPVIILNKSDECYESEKLFAQAEEISMGVPIHLTSAKFEVGIDELHQYIISGETVAFIGSSGVGKSSIVNILMGKEKMFVNHTRDGDNRGRHTTTHREMLLLPEGGVLIDNPGMRDIKLAASEEALNNTFSDIKELSENCKFRDCKHRSEPGCAVKEAIMNGNLSEKRLNNYRKLIRELLYLKRRNFYKQKYFESGNWEEDNYLTRKNKPYQIKEMEKAVEEFNSK